MFGQQSKQFDLPGFAHAEGPISTLLVEQTPMWPFFFLSNERQLVKDGKGHYYAPFRGWEIKTLYTPGLRQGLTSYARSRGLMLQGDETLFLVSIGALIVRIGI
jgi:hypothetical protein